MLFPVLPLFGLVDFVHGACGFAVFVINGGILYVDENNSQLWLLASEYVLKAR